MSEITIRVSEEEKSFILAMADLRTDNIGIS
ncbi:hypothetical protein A5802_002270 [Enterococcus mundtii]|uniref:Uncharacterized protein n=1 Tax=Enterococcus mundtii TaxID=53346 RepID=A0A242L3B8_ENTMU|nr:hypothetical protein A5802_002270 [Enterococcus mundtii]